MTHRLLSLSLELGNRPSPDGYRERRYASNGELSAAVSNIHQRAIFSARRSTAQPHQPDRAGRSRSLDGGKSQHPQVPMSDEKWSSK